MSSTTQTQRLGFIRQKGLVDEKPVQERSCRQPMVFYVFLAWAFVLIDRPQDIFTFLSQLSPVASLGLVTILLFAIQHQRYVHSSVLMTTQGKLYIGLVGIMILSVLFATYRAGAFKFLTMFYVNVVIFFILFCKIIDSAEKIEKLIFLICLGALLYGLFALLKGVSIGDRRISYGGVLDANDLAFFLVSFLPFNFLFLSKRNKFTKRFISLTNLFISSLVILMTGSRGGLISIIFVVFGILFARRQSIKQSYKVAIITLSIMAVALGASTINFSRLGTIASISNDYNIWDETGRVQIWKRGLDLMLSHPLTGVGVSCFAEAIGRDRTMIGMREIWQSPHNTLVQIGAETGLIGLILFSLISYRVFIIFGHSKRVGVRTGLPEISEIARIGFIGHCVAGMFLSQAYSVYWAFYVALSAVLHRIATNAENR